MEGSDFDDYWESSNINSNIFLEDSIEKEDEGYSLAHVTYKKQEKTYPHTCTNIQQSSQAIINTAKSFHSTSHVSPSISSQSSSTIKKNLGLLNSLRKNHSFSSSPLNLQLPKLSALNLSKYSIIGNDHRLSISSNASLQYQPEDGVGEYIGDIDPSFLSLIDQIIFDCSTIIDFSDNKSSDLSRFKTKYEKCQLLDAALLRCEGNTTLKIIIHLKNTLSNAMFLQILATRPSAMKQYINYLRKCGDVKALTDCVRVCLGSKAAMMSEIETSTKMATKQSQDLPLASKIQHLSQIKSHWLNPPSLISSSNSTHAYAVVTGGIDTTLEANDEDCQHLSHYLSLLKRQFTLYQLDLSNSISVPESEHEKLLNSSLHDTIKYCLIYHHHSDNSLSPTSAHSIFEEYKPAPKTILWIALMSLAKHLNWREFNDVVYSKSYAFKQKMSLQPKQILEILVISRSPKEVINKYINLLISPEDQAQALIKYSQS